MLRRKIVAGNWKMNKTLTEARELVKSLQSLIGSDVQERVVIIPPFPFLGVLSSDLSGSSIHLGAQDCSAHAQGAYTGEVSAGALKSVGCSYVLVGHSERRGYHHEQETLLIEKTKQALLSGLTVILCVGESLEERRNGSQEQVVGKQIMSIWNALNDTERAQLIMAYEPVWAIGTGETASPEQAQSMHAFIRALIKDNYGDALADNLTILYGGSCNAQNAKELFACPDIDGGLIGGASLKADDFTKIVYSL